MIKRLVSLAAAGLMAGCSLIPDYDRPALPTAPTWPEGAAYTPAADGNPAKPAPADIGWADFFTDPKLSQLITIALANNRDLRVAALNVEASRAQYQIQQADLFPSISATGSGTDQRVPANLSSSGRTTISRQYNVGLGFTSYELDLFGRVRSLKDQALETYFAEEETRASTQITLVSEVANDYLTLLADQDLLRLTRDTLASQKQSYELTLHSASHGVDTQLDLLQAETSVRTAEANLAQYTRQVAQDRNALVLLLGQSLPPELDTDTSNGGALESVNLVSDLPAGLPSALLERRPDVRAAEHNLKAANANIGAARAAFFPTISLTASGGLSSSSLSNLFRGAAATWAFEPNISVPIFEAGKLEGDLDYAKIQKDIQVAQYEKAIQSAFKDVADALAARGTLDDQLAAQAAMVKASALRYKLSDMRFRGGVEGYLNTLDAQRTLYSAQQTLISARLSRLSNLVTLYKALGGGWAEHVVVAPAKASDEQRRL
jgi:outer membrane protein, multidrug efflux system